MRIKANGIQMHYELSGKQDAPVLILSHSLASSLIMWDPQMDALKSHFQILRYDVRGHGGTEAPKGPYTLKLLVEDVMGLIDSLDIRSIHWVGLSMGGMIGQGLALDHADRLKSLALCDTASFVSEEAQPLWQERFDAVRGEGMQALVDATMERWFTPFFLRLNPPMVQKIRQEILKTPVEGYVGCGEAIRRLNYMDRLGEINLPTLIIVGEEDPGTPVSSAQAIHERIAESKLVILPSARHLSNVEQPEAFNSALLGFLRNL